MNLNQNACTDLCYCDVTCFSKMLAGMNQNDVDNSRSQMGCFSTPRAMLPETSNASFFKLMFDNFYFECNPSSQFCSIHFTTL